MTLIKSDDWDFDARRSTQSAGGKAAHTLARSVSALGVELPWSILLMQGGRKYTIVVHEGFCNRDGTPHLDGEEYR